MSEPRQRIIVGISGASGAIYGVRLLQALRTLPGIETHAVISDAGWLNITHELGLERTHAPALADVVHSIDHIGASIASGSFHASAMVVAPCSMRTLAAIAHGLADNLLNVGTFFKRHGQWVTAEELSVDGMHKAVKDMNL